MGYSEAGGKLIHEKNQKQKISLHCPFKIMDGLQWINTVQMFETKFTVLDGMAKNLARTAALVLYV